MAVQESSKSGTASVAGKVDPMAAARAARKPRDPNLPVLTPRQKFLLQNVRQASKACKLLAEILNAGADISPAAAEACNVLSSEYVKATD